MTMMMKMMTMMMMMMMMMMMDASLARRTGEVTFNSVLIFSFQCRVCLENR